MKRMDNRQNKRIQMTGNPHPLHTPKLDSHGYEQLAPTGLPGHSSGSVYGLVSNILVATKIAKAAAHCHLGVHNFDKAEALLAHCKQKIPILVIFDWDGCEAEAFKVLKEFNANADLKKVANIGFYSKGTPTLKEEARRAGCHRVYGKNELMQNLEMIVARYAA